MKRLVTLLLAVLLLGVGAGCGSTPIKGAHKDKDMPKPADKDG